MNVYILIIVLSSSAPCTVGMYVLMYMVVHSTGVSLNAGDMASGNLLKTLVSKEKRRYKEGGYDLDLTCIPPSLFQLSCLFVVQLLETCWGR